MTSRTTPLQPKLKAPALWAIAGDDWFELSFSDAANASNEMLAAPQDEFLATIPKRKREAEIHFNLATAPRAVAETPRARFDRLVRTWKAETKLSSHSSSIIFNPSYQKVIGMGPSVIPWILAELNESGGQWFYALEILTDENPVREEDTGSMKAVRRRWLDWGRDRGLL